MTQDEMLFTASFWLGKAHGGMVNILENETSSEYKVQQLAELELQIRSAVEKLYYTTQPSQQP